MTTRMLFNEEMRSLNQEIIRMGDLAREMIKKGVQAFLENDADLRSKVEELDHQIYLTEQAIEKHCVEIVALHQPVAGDLRMVTTSLKIITDLNRIGRYGQDISELAGNGEGGKRMKKLVAVPLMAELVMGMVNDAIGSFVNRDDGMARGLFIRDDEIDSLLQQGRVETDIGKRKEIFQQFEARLTELSPWIWLSTSNIYTAQLKTISGFESSATGTLFGLTKVTLGQ